MTSTSLLHNLLVTGSQLVGVLVNHELPEKFRFAVVTSQTRYRYAALSNSCRFEKTVLVRIMRGSVLSFVVQLSLCTRVCVLERVVLLSSMLPVKLNHAPAAEQLHRSF